MTRAAAIVAPVWAVLLAGCPAPTPPPLLSLEQVVEKLNENNERLSALKGRMPAVALTAVDENGRTGRVSLRGLMCYHQPIDFYMEAIYAEQKVMAMTSNSRFYWFYTTAYPRKAGWIGEQDGPAPDELPIDPRQLIELLGITVIPTDLLEPPWPVLRVNEPAQANVLEFIAPARGRMVLLRELWVQRCGPDANRPRMVRLFDRDGQAVLESALKDWRPARGSGGLFPHDVTVRWLARQAPPGPKRKMHLGPGSELRLQFSGVEVDAKYADPDIYRQEIPADVPVTWLGAAREVAPATTEDDL